MLHGAGGAQVRQVRAFPPQPRRDGAWLHHLHLRGLRDLVKRGEQAKVRLALEISLPVDRPVIAADGGIQLDTRPLARGELSGSEVAEGAGLGARHGGGHDHPVPHLQGPGRSQAGGGLGRRHRRRRGGAFPEVSQAGGRTGRRARLGLSAETGQGVGRHDGLLAGESVDPGEDPVVGGAAEVDLPRHAPIILALGLLQLHPHPVPGGELGGAHVADVARLGAAHPYSVPYPECVASF